jgi:hypothetical protein
MFLEVGLGIYELINKPSNLVRVVVMAAGVFNSRIHAPRAHSKGMASLQFFHLKIKGKHWLSGNTVQSLK